MTTTYTGPTPWDAEIAEHRGKPDAWFYGNRLECKAEGYRHAMQDCAPLLEALKAIKQELGWMPGGEPPDSPKRWLSVAKAFEIADAAIAQAEGRDQPASPHP